MTTATAIPELPSADDLALVGHNAGTVLSALDDLRSTLERLRAGEDVTPSEFEERKARGDLPTPPTDAEAIAQRDRLAHICMFATSLLDDADTITVLATDIRREAMQAYYETVPSGEGAAYWRRVREWHAAEAARGGDAS